MFLARKKENEAACCGDAQRAHPSPSRGPPHLSLSKAVSASGSQHSSRPPLSVTVTSVKCKLDFFKCRTKTALIVPSRGTAGT